RDPLVTGVQTCALPIFTAALLLGFFLTFGIPAAVMALAPDLLMVLPHLAAIYFAWRRRPFLAGLAAGFGVLVNPKCVYVFAACQIGRASCREDVLIMFG